MTTSFSAHTLTASTGRSTVGTMNPWFRSVTELHGHVEPEQLSPEGYESAQAIIDASDELKAPGGQLLLIDLKTDVATRYVAMPAGHRHGQDCGRC